MTKLSHTPAALGCRAHSGWAALIAIGAPVRSPEVLVRRRIDLIRPGTPKQPYHAAEGLPLDQARRIIQHSMSEARLLARRAFREAIREITGKNHTVVGCGVTFTSERSLPGLAATLKSHPLIHTAEGQHFRSALAYAGEQCKLPIAHVRERALFEFIAEVFRTSTQAIQARVQEMGRAVGPPWTQDEKYATVAAWTALIAASFSVED